jgi:hypothetical protein
MKTSHDSDALDQSELDSLLADLCVRYGFCLPSHEHDKLFANPPQEVMAFVDAVFTAEGLNPETVDRNTYRAVRDRVAESFGRCVGQGELRRVIGQSSQNDT